MGGRRDVIGEFSLDHRRVAFYNQRTARAALITIAIEERAKTRLRIVKNNPTKIVSKQGVPRPQLKESFSGHQKMWVFEFWQSQSQRYAASFGFKRCKWGKVILSDVIRSMPKIGCVRRNSPFVNPPKTACCCTHRSGCVRPVVRTT